MASELALPEGVRDAPSTVTAVYLALERAGPLTYDALAEEIGASRRGVRDAIGALRDQDLVEAEPDATEPCRKRWSITSG